jgi:AraC-like DNA-binding protein
LGADRARSAVRAQLIGDSFAEALLPRLEWCAQRDVVRARLVSCLTWAALRREAPSSCDAANEARDHAAHCPLSRVRDFRCLALLGRFATCERRVASGQSVAKSVSPTVMPGQSLGPARRYGAISLRALCDLGRASRAPLAGVSEPRIEPEIVFGLAKAPTPHTDEEGRRFSLLTQLGPSTRVLTYRTNVRYVSRRELLTTWFWAKTGELKTGESPTRPLPISAGEISRATRADLARERRGRRYYREERAMLQLTAWEDRYGLPAVARTSSSCNDRSTSNIAWDLVSPKPYELVLRNSTDVICLLFGKIEAKTGYDGERPTDMCFDPLSIAFHPGGGEVSVCASQVSGGFVAFAFPPAFREDMFGDDATVGGVTRSVDNILSPTVTSLVSYARTAMLGHGCCEALCIESLAYLAYSEAICGMRALRERTCHRALSKRALDRLLAHIEDNIAEPLSIAELAKIVALPIATLRRQFLQFTGRSLHQVIIERRLQHACNLLLKADSPISDVSAASGFSSQQHMTMTFRNRLGTTPRAFRRANGGA